MDEVVKLLRTLQGIERVKEKIRTLVLNLNDITDQNIKVKEVEKLKVLHKLQRAQQLTLRGATGESYNLVNEVIVDILDERKIKTEVVQSCGGLPVGFIPND